VARQSSILGALPLLALAVPVWPAMLRCTTHEEKTLQRRHTICDDRTLAVSRDHTIGERCEMTTASPRNACMGGLNPRTQPLDVRYRGLD
jgi:hypothetical protein